jgi:hypothetical protein
VWAKPVDMNFDLGPGRLAGSALLAMPLQLVPSAPGERVTIPGPLTTCVRVIDGAQTPLTLDSTQSAEMDLRFQLPASVLPLKVEQAHLSAKIHAPARRVTIAARAAGQPVELHHADSPIDPLRVDINDGRFLGLDADGGLHLVLSISASAKGTQREQKWSIDYLELEVSGQVMGP